MKIELFWEKCCRDGICRMLGMDGWEQLNNVTADAVRSQCEDMLSHILPPQTFVVGRTTVFAKDGSSRHLHDWLTTQVCLLLFFLFDDRASHHVRNKPVTIGGHDVGRLQTDCGHGYDMQWFDIDHATSAPPSADCKRVGEARCYSGNTNSLSLWLHLCRR